MAPINQLALCMLVYLVNTDSILATESLSNLVIGNNLSDNIGADNIVDVYA